MQKKCNRGEFVTHLREVYVTAVVGACSALNADHDNWCHLLAEKGAQMSSQKLKEDFINSYERECACSDGLTEPDWENLVHTRRSRLGTRVNTFIKDVEKFIRNIPDPDQIYLMANAIAISNETFLSSPDKHSRRPPNSVCFIICYHLLNYVLLYAVLD
jgi:hypothetical protein